MGELSPTNLLLLSLQAAMLGEVTARLFAVTAGIEDHTIRIRGYFTGPVTEDDVETMQFIGTEVISDFPAPYMIEEETLSLDDHPLECLQRWAFKRKSDET